MLPMFKAIKQFCRSYSVRLLRISNVFAFILSNNIKWVPVSMDLIFRKRQNLQGVRSDE
jgi:hypothetical protein